MKDVNTYLGGLPDPEKQILEHIRSVVIAHVPEATESISYAMPAFKYKGRPLFYFAAFKNHMSVFPTAEPAEALDEALTAYRTSKGTIQFTVDNVLPDDLIRRLIDIRLAAITKT